MLSLAYQHLERSKEAVEAAEETSRNLESPATLTLRVVPVQVVRYSAADIYLSAGLKPGDRVVIAGVNKLRPDMKVALYKEQER